MAGTVIGDIVGDVITEISQVPGVATQIYSQDRIRQFVQNAWLLEINELWWPTYMFIQTVGLDGTTGAITADLKGSISFVDDYEDIQSVFPEGSNRKLRELNQSINPQAMVSGKAWYIAPDYTYAHRPFKVYPPSSTGNVVVVARQKHELPFTLDTVVYLDRLLLMYDACWMYTVDDGTVPAQVNKFQMLAGNRRKQIKAGFAQQPLELDPRFPSGELLQGADSGWFTIDADPLA